MVACGPHEFVHPPTGSVLDVVAGSQRGDHEAQVRLDGFAQVVIDRSASARRTGAQPVALVRASRGVA